MLNKKITILIVSIIFVTILMLLGVYYYNNKVLVSNEVKFLDNLTSEDQSFLETKANMNILTRENSTCNVGTKEDIVKCNEKILLLQAIMLRKVEYCDQLVYYRDNCLSNIAQKTNNLELCNELSQDIAKEYCHDNIVYREANKSKDFTQCNEIYNEIKMNKCLSEVQ